MSYVLIMEEHAFTKLSFMCMFTLLIFLDACLQCQVYRCMFTVKSKKMSNDQELIQSDPISCPQNQKGNN